MKLLLDTHVLIWLVEGSESLSQAAKEAIENDDNSGVAGLRYETLGRGNS